MAKTKIIVLQMKEIIYTAIFVGLGILLILLLIFMFQPSKETTAPTSNEYESGVYTSQIQLGKDAINLEVIVDDSQIKSVSLVNLEDSITTLYPLVKPSISYLEEELIKGTAPDKITLTDKGKYTQTLLLEGIKKALAQAPASQSPQ